MRRNLRPRDSWTRHCREICNVRFDYGQPVNEELWVTVGCPHMMSKHAYYTF
ncbi:hypothetical protein KIN20_024685 [Parelaphostrongylus tenuis]|uniref:Uncharacterized protein n=1 Tax=Parelaphostrongylus tenuis TaxID=148309 RepID=A0AAD5MYL2_PARTN|nr:hypothetical protein KIN20_024685 [Parelaphostrongylus tenuis]